MKQLLLRFVGALALLFLFSNQLFSQGQSTTQGRDFWLSYGQNAGMGPQANMLQLRIVAIKPTKVTLTYTIDNTTETINVAAGQVYTRMFDVNEQGNRIKMSLPLRYGKDRLFLYCTGSSSEGTLQAQVERHINHRYSYLSLWRRRLRIYV